MTTASWKRCTIGNRLMLYFLDCPLSRNHSAVAPRPIYCCSFLGGLLRLHDMVDGLGCGATEPASASTSGRAVRVLSKLVTVSSNHATAAPGVPDNLIAAPAAANLRLWLYDPRKMDGAGLASGIFLQNMPATSGWKFIPAYPDGSLYLYLEPGNYQLDTVEPPRMAAT